jgi:hypothetical protein
LQMKVCCKFFCFYQQVSFESLLLCSFVTIEKK